MTKGFRLKFRSAPIVLVCAVGVGVVLLILLPTKNEALTGGAIAVLTLSVNQAFDLVRRRSEERRWHAEQFLRDKIDCLRKLFGAIDDWYRTLNQYGNYPPTTLGEWRTKIVAKESVFLEALAYAQIYLSAEDDEVVRKAMAQFRIAQISVCHALPESEFPAGRGHAAPATRVFPWSEFFQSHDAAVGVLSRLLNPRSLRRLEESMQTE